jgi:hypothetical protein
MTPQIYSRSQEYIVAIKTHPGAFEVLSILLTASSDNAKLTILFGIFRPIKATCYYDDHIHRTCT